MHPEYGKALEAAHERLAELTADLEVLPTAHLPAADQFRTELVREYLADTRATVEAKLEQ